MNIRKVLAVAGIMAIASTACFGQAGFDAYGAMRTVVVTPPQLISGGNAGAITNPPVDIRIFTGVVVVNAIAQTNTTGTCTVTPQTSTDNTNWVSLANYSLASAATVIWTNNYYAQGANNITVTNTFLLPGTITTPTAATAGFATPYLLAAPFTNSGAITFGSGPVSFGFKADDALRYFRLLWQPGGTATNLTVAATMTGRYYPNPLVP